MIIFGAVGVFVKYIRLSSSEIAMFLSLIGTISLLVVLIYKKQDVPWSIVKKNIFYLLLASLSLSGNWIFLFQSYKHTTIANAALSYYFAPVLVTMLSPLVLKDKLSIKKVVCIGGSLLGLCFILQNGKMETSGNHILGIGYGLIAASFYAALTLINKFIQGLDGLINTLLQLGLAVMILLPFVVLTDSFNLSSLTGKEIILIILLGVLHGGVGFYMFFTGMKALKAQSIAVLSYVDPLTSLLISALIIGDKMNLLQIMGTVLLLGSIWIGDTKTSEKIDTLFNH
jgi:drug/metabolite transporter (DMT)-like permease